MCDLASTVFWFMRLGQDCTSAIRLGGEERLGSRRYGEAHWEDWIYPGHGHKPNLTHQETITNAGSTQASRVLEESKLAVEQDTTGVQVKVQGDGDAKSQTLDDGGTSNSFAAFRYKNKGISISSILWSDVSR